MSFLQGAWFHLILVLLIGYTILAGFDLGVGLWCLLVKKAEERRTILTAIGPFWDGNEVWLVTAGGALFAAFPPVYATVFSSFYLPLMLVLLALITRAVSLEFGAHEANARHRTRWGTAFALSSMLAIVLFGVAFGNILHGLPIDAAGNLINPRGEFLGPLLAMLHPFALLVGVLNLAMLSTHGALYLALRTEGDLAQRASRWAQGAGGVTLALVVAAVTTAACTQPHLLAHYRALPVLWMLPTAAVAAGVLALWWNRAAKALPAFLASSVSMALLLAAAAGGLFPALVPALHHPEWTLTAGNASSSPLTLKTMLIMAFLGMPIVLGYTLWVHRVFGDKVKGDAHY